MTINTHLPPEQGCFPAKEYTEAVGAWPFLLKFCTAVGKSRDSANIALWIVGHNVSMCLASGPFVQDPRNDAEIFNLYQVG